MRAITERRNAVLAEEERLRETLRRARLRALRPQWFEVGGTGGGEEPLGLELTTPSGRYKVEYAGESEEGAGFISAAAFTPTGGQTVSLGEFRSEGEAGEKAALAAAEAHLRGE